MGAHPVLPGQPLGGTRPPQLACHLPAHRPVAFGSPLSFGQNQGSLVACQWGCMCSSVWGALEDPCLVTDPCGQLSAPKRGPTLLGHLPILMLVPGATGHQPSDAEPLGPPTELSRARPMKTAANRSLGANTLNKKLKRMVQFSLLRLR